jgi:hypothetical protein
MLSAFAFEEDVSYIKHGADDMHVPSKAVPIDDGDVIRPFTQLSKSTTFISR